MTDVHNVNGGIGSLLSVYWKNTIKQDWHLYWFCY